MLNFLDYKIIETLYEGVNTVIYRVLLEKNNTLAIAKTFKTHCPTLEDSTRLRHEHKILQALNIEGVVKPYNLESYNNRLVLILEDFGGESLKKFIANKKLNLNEFLLIAIQLASILAQVHSSRIIHKDIKPHNILINPETRQVKITDFSIASYQFEENQTINNTNLLEGTLAYMSPEQTGRMNRSIDYRSDFYSLGVTFYEMLTNQLPFDTTDPMELVHCHLAKTPITPEQIDPKIPAAISSIVMKLLAKTSEERYQNAYGLKADLDTCLTQLEVTGRIENFQLGQSDKLGRLLISQKLYSRDSEVASLISAFERVRLGTSEMMLISGYSGIGKSVLVNEIHKSIAKAQGYFISGKFDHLKQNIPYASIIQAFQSLIQQLLTESSQQIESWKKELLKAFGQNGQVIIDVIPEVKLIVGSQPEVLQLGATESQNRFNRVFKEFVNVFTKKGRPLVIFLDDLQWADSASLKLINFLVSDPDSQYLFLIGAYRDNEIGNNHPLTLTLERMKKTNAVVNEVKLSALTVADISQLIADTLNSDTESVDSLANLLFEKTAGNPFFLNHLLQTLNQENLLSFDFIACRWQWDIEVIKGQEITENVIELMVGKIQQLSENTQEILKLAACIGNRFNLLLLSALVERSPSFTATQIGEALQAGLIVPLNNADIPLVGQKSQISTGDEAIEYKFLHDRVQQAAYSLIPELQKQQVHLEIGQTLLKNTNLESREENIFEIVNHLNFGAALISCQVEKYELAQLNLLAGQKAKASTAYEPAVKYLNIGLGLLLADSWIFQYDLTLSLYIETMEAEYLNTNFERANQLSSIILQQAKTLLEKIRVYEIIIQSYTFQKRMEEAVDIALKVLKMMGISLVKQPSKLNIFTELLLTKWAMKGKQVKDLANLPKMTDPYKLAAVRILISVIPSTYIANPEIFPLIIFTLVKLCIKYGNSSLSAYAYCQYGLILSGSLGQIETGYQFGQLALRLLEEFNPPEIRAKVDMVYNFFIRHWKEHIRETTEPLLEAVQSGLEVGDIEYACYAAGFYCNTIFFAGEPLEYVADKQTQNIDFMQKLKQETFLSYTEIWRKLALNLMDKSLDRSQLLKNIAKEEQELDELINENNKMSLFSAYVAKATIFYLFKEPSLAIERAKLAEKYENVLIGMMHIAQNNFYYSLALLAQYPHVSKSSKRQFLNKAIANQKKMQKWASQAPANYQHKYQLVEAEKARIMGQEIKAVELYEQAIKGARTQGYVQEEALAYELAAEFYLAKGREEIARTYMTKARYSYSRWGAIAKVRDLEARYPQFFYAMQKQEINNIKRIRTTTVSTTGSNTDILDLGAVTKASLALASEIVLDKLLDKLMKIVIENAGAQTSCLILIKDDCPVIEATASVQETNLILERSTPAATSQSLPLSLINYAVRTQSHVVLDDATKEGIFTTDPYIIKTQPKSILCMPIIYHGKLTGLLYLENNLAAGAFTAERLEVLKVLSSQVAISLENALLYANLSTATEDLRQANDKLEDRSLTLEAKVQERTVELQEKNIRLREQATQLEIALQELQETQSQLIQTEKMSSLGQMVAGVAHEINNPINFIYGNLSHANQYVQDLLEMFHLYQQQYPNPTSEIIVKTEALDLDFLKKDLPKLLSSMKLGTERIRQIVLSLRNFSRLDEAAMKAVDIHEGLDNTLLILNNRFQDEKKGFEIELIKEYGTLPLVECYAGQMNQVFMNILSNAIDSLEKQLEPRRITIRTEIGSDLSLRRSEVETPAIAMSSVPSLCSTVNAKVGAGQILAQRPYKTQNQKVVIRIADNGVGMPESVCRRLFDPFFTTKPVGSGTGLGLSISYKIVVENHLGRLYCVSAPGQGAEFVIEIPVCQQNH